MDAIAYFVRHGETDWNRESRFQGQADTDINETGRQQARGNGERLAELVPDGAGFDFVASPLRRTRQTMEIIRAAMGLEPQGYRIEPRIAELHFGDFQGLTMDELDQRQPGLAFTRESDKWNFLPPGGLAESYEMLRQRITPWLDEIAKPTICVTHGGIVRCMFRMFEELDEAEAAAMHVPQDRILRLAGGRLEWL